MIKFVVGQRILCEFQGEFIGISLKLTKSFKKFIKF
jgi:hypothetical protein